MSKYIILYRIKDEYDGCRYIELNRQEEEYASGSKSKGLEISGYYKSCGNVAKIGEYKYIVSKNFEFVQ